MAFSVNCSGWGLILGAALLLFIPLPWIVAAVSAALIHELSHYIAVRSSGNDIIEITVTHHGVLMQTTPLTHRQELLCALAGPAGSLLLCCCCRRIPRIGICAGVQGLFNLLPVYPLDGGRVLRSIGFLLFSPAAACLFCRFAMLGSCALLLLAGLYCTYCLRMGIGPLLLSLLLLSRAFSEKFLAKREN